MTDTVTAPVQAERPAPSVGRVARVTGPVVDIEFPAGELPEIATITRQVSRRDGRVYVDYLQNGSGKLLVAPFCVRPLPGAPVSTPLAWREVNRTLDIRRHTMETVPKRMQKMGTDPLAEVLEVSPDLGAALERLQGELE